MLRAVRAIQADYHHLVAKILADLMNLVDHAVQFSRIPALPAAPPLLKRRALAQLIVKDRVGLAQELAQVRHADIQQRLIRNSLQQVARIPRLGKRNLLNPALQRSELPHQHQVLVAIRAPRNLFRHWNRIEVVAGRNLVPGMDHGLNARMRHIHCALHHGHPRTFHARIDREHRTGHRYTAIRSFHIQMSRCTMRRLDDHRTVIQGHRHIASASANPQRAPFANLYPGAIRQPDHRTRATAGPQQVALAQSYPPAIAADRFRSRCRMPNHQSIAPRRARPGAPANTPCRRRGRRPAARCRQPIPSHRRAASTLQLAAPPPEQSSPAAGPPGKNGRCCIRADGPRSACRAVRAHVLRGTRAAAIARPRSYESSRLPTALKNRFRAASPLSPPPCSTSQLPAHRSVLHQWRAAPALHHRFSSLSPVQFLQPLFQPRPRMMQRHRHHRLRSAHQRRNFSIAHFFQIPQREHLGGSGR